MFTKREQFLVVVIALLLLFTPMLDAHLMLGLSLMALFLALVYSFVIFPHQHA